MLIGKVGTLYDLFEENGDEYGFCVMHYLQRANIVYKLIDYDINWDCAICDRYIDNKLKNFEYSLYDDGSLYIVVAERRFIVR